MAAISNSNIWAVGQNYNAAGGIIYKPFIRHFNGSSWRAITIPDSSGTTSEWVSASSANNVWIGGRKNTSLVTSVVYRWNGARWHKVPMPALSFLRGIVVLAPDNVWAFGDTGRLADNVLHWNGTKWRGYLSNALNFVPDSISASAANNVWVAGWALSRGKKVVAAYRWNGTAWHAVSMPHPVRAVTSVTAVSRSNVWVGYDTARRSYALHWDGRQWHTMTVPTAPVYADPLNIVPDGKGGYWFGPFAIWTGSTWIPEQVQLPHNYSVFFPP